MNSYKSALTKLKKNKFKIKNEVVSIKKSLNRISAFDIISQLITPHLIIQHMMVSLLTQ